MILGFFLLTRKNPGNCSIKSEILNFDENTWRKYKRNCLLRFLMMVRRMILIHTRLLRQQYCGRDCCCGLQFKTMLSTTIVTFWRISHSSFSSLYFQLSRACIELVKRDSITTLTIQIFHFFTILTPVVLVIVFSFLKSFLQNLIFKISFVIIHLIWKWWMRSPLSSIA